MPERSRLRNLSKRNSLRQRRMNTRKKQQLNRENQLNAARILYPDLEIANAFETFQKSIKSSECVKCNRKFFDIKVNEHSVCLYCQKCESKNLPNMFTAQNDMDPGIQPPELQSLSYVEEQLIAQIHPVISVYRIKGNQYGYSGQVINFPQDITNFVQQLQLPKTIQEISNVIVVRREQLDHYKDFIVRRSKIEEALKWLITNNKWYRHVKVSIENLSALPEDESVYRHILTSQNVQLQTSKDSMSQSEETDDNVDELCQVNNNLF